MRIAANLGVLDEVDLIGPCIDHLRSIGVDLIVVTDIGSTDGTRDVLYRLSGSSDVCLIELGPDEDPWGFPERMYERTVSEFAVDRILTLDADEFWLPRTGNIQDAAGLLGTDVLTVRRFNVPPVAGRRLLPAVLSPATYGQVSLVVNPVEKAWLKFAEDPNLAWIMTQVASKVMVNPRAIQVPAMGGHGVVPREDVVATTAVCEDVVIAHAPFSTYPRFLRKIQNVGRSLERFGDRLVPGQGWHWRRWLDLARAGQAEEEFHRQILSEEQFQAALAHGTIRSAREWLSSVP
jgi:hypothetical protein